MGTYREAYDRIDEYVTRWISDQNVPGLGLALTDRAGTLRLTSYGFANTEAGIPVTLSTQFETGSTGKSFTSLCLMKLHDEGVLDLHKPVSEYLPWFSVKSSHAPITAHHLLSHTSGLIGGGLGAPHELYDAWATTETEVGGPPGQRFHYSNVGYAILTLLLERLAEREYADILQSQVLDPLGMSETHAVITHESREFTARGYWPRYDDRPAPPGNPLIPAPWHEYGMGDGSLASTPGDMATYLRMFLNRGEGPEGRVLSESGYKLMMQRAVKSGFGANSYYGYGLMTMERDGQAYLGHGGSTLGFKTAMLADVNSGLGAVVLVNGSVMPHEVAEFALGALGASKAGIGLPEVPATPDPSVVPNAAEFAGRYRGEGGEFTVEAEGDRATLSTDAGRCPLERRGDDVFYVDLPEYTLHLMSFGRIDGQVVEAFHGHHRYTNENYAGRESFDYPPQWDAFVGHYSAHNPWYPHIRAIVRKGRLMLQVPTLLGAGVAPETPLTPMPGDWFRVDEDEASPERIRFDTVVGGRALKATLFNTDFYRTFTP